MLQVDRLICTEMPAMELNLKFGVNRNRIIGLDKSVLRESC